MPSTRAERIVRYLVALLAALDRAGTAAGLWGGRVALALLVLSGAALALVDARAAHISVPMLRGLHVLAGLVLLLAVAGRLLGGLLRVARHLVRRRGLPPEEVRRLLAACRRPGALLGMGYWLVVGMLLLSGVERYLHLRHGLALLPGPGPAGWEALHRALQPYLYAALLLLAVNRGRMVTRRMMAYLYSP